MNNFSHTRNTRNLLDPKSFPRNQFSVYNYSMDAHTKNDMKHIFGDDLIINNLHLIPDPLKKNLADSVITGEVKKKTMLETKDYVEVKPQVPKNQRSDYYLSFATIANFVTGMFNNMGALFNKSSDTSSQYDDCFEEYDDQKMAPPHWQSSKLEVQNKNEQTDSIFSSDSYTNLDVTMNVDCKIAASNCQEKLNQVRLLLSNKKQNNGQNTKYQSRRPKKIFVEPGSVEESYEDAFCTENCTNLPNNADIECYSPHNYHDEYFMAAEGCKIKTEDIKESMDIITDLDVNKCNDVNQNVKTIDNTMANDIVSACDDKINKLKALLQSKRSKPEKNQMIETPPIPIREVVSETSELQLSNDSQDSDYFNEVAGKFVSSSVDSDDSFQIVFADEPTSIRRRLSSDCESEDSIVFADTPENCYLSNDVFGNDESDDSDSENEDSGTTCKLSPSLSRTFGDLTDNSLYCIDEVDSANMCDTIDHIRECEVEEDYKGLLLNEKRKLQKKKLPAKKVHFSSDPPKVHVMRVWAFAARQARAGHWERHALDRERFKRRIADVEMAISWVLKPQHRSRVVFQRFRPWWNAQRRKELAEKKLEEEKRLEEEKQREKEKENEKLRELQINGENTTEVFDSEDLADVQETKKLLEDEIVDKSGKLNHLDDVSDKTSKNNNVIETKGPMDKDDGNICKLKSCIERDQSNKQNNEQFELDMPQLIEKLNSLNLIENDIISNENVT